MSRFMVTFVRIVHSSSIESLNPLLIRPELLQTSPSRSKPPSNTTTTAQHPTDKLFLFLICGETGKKEF